MTYGLRGIAYYKINVTGPGADLHSGVFGRMVHEPMTDLILLMSKLVDQTGKILVPGVDEMVAAADAEERYETELELPDGHEMTDNTGLSMRSLTTLLRTSRPRQVPPSP